MRQLRAQQQQAAIVTGAGQGIGAAIAHALAAVGVCVTVNDLNPDRAEKTAVAITEAGGQALAVPGDVSNKFQCVHLIESSRDQWGRLDILVNNAGIQPRTPILKMDEWEWNRCLEVNLKSVFFMSQLCGRVMAEENRERGGAIVNIAATAGAVTAWPNRAVYCAASAGVVGFARECAREFAAYHIRVNTILAGLIATPMTEQALKDEVLQTAVASNPLQTIGQPEDVAQAVLYLCGENGRYLTGTTLTIDGGQTIV
ncbi:MAG: glucose 1-dehydrogenase [Chloroflexota bacterium]